MKSESVLVTGGAGFIGSNIAHELVDRNCEVKVLDNFYLGDRKNLDTIEEDIEIIEGSILEKNKVQKAVEGVDKVFHLAARSSAPMHKENPVKSTKVNVAGFVNVASAAEDHNVEKMVYASTSSMYGSVQPPHRPGQGETPVNMYSASKMARERYSEAWRSTLDLETTGLRLFSVYGPRERAKGKFANVISQFIWKMNEGKRPKVFGDGTQTRDFTFVRDVVKAFLKASAENPKTDGEVFNVGTGIETNFNEVIEIINDVLDTKVDPRYVENPIENYVERTKADISETREKLGWKPETEVRDGIEKTAGFYRSK